MGHPAEQRTDRARRLLIVGCATGIAAASARLLVDDGWQLALLCSCSISVLLIPVRPSQACRRRRRARRHGLSHCLRIVPPSLTQGAVHGMWRSLVSAPALGAGGRGFESRHPDQLFSNVLSITGLHGDSRCLSRHVVRCGSLSVHVGSLLCIRLISSCLSDLRLAAVAAVRLGRVGA